MKPERLVALIVLTSMSVACTSPRPDRIEQAKEAVRYELQDGALSFRDVNARNNVVCGVVGHNSRGAGYRGARMFIVRFSDDGSRVTFGPPIGRGMSLAFRSREQECGFEALWNLCAQGTVPDVARCMRADD